MRSFHTTMTSKNRRQFLKSAALGAAGLASCSSGPESKEQPSGSNSQPNVLLIYTDEHSNWTLGAYGGKVAATPHLDSIGREGAIFNNFFVNSAVCTPSRGCLITGRYPHSHGAHTNNLELGRGQVTLAHLLRRQGYETGMAGKWHLDGEPRPGWITAERSMGFDDCQWMYNRGHWKRVIEKPEGWPDNRSVSRAGQQVYVAEEPDGRPDMDYSIRAEGEFFTDWLTGKALEFIKRPRDKPFFYYLSIPDPHGPDSVRAPYDTMFKPEDMPVPPTLYQEDLPDWAAATRDRTAKAEGASSWRDPGREQLLRKRLAQYYGMVKCIDDNVGRILDTLREQNLLDNTLIVFTSDHGDYMGEHGLYNKNQLYETAHNVSMLMRWPRGIPGGTVVEECVSTVDVQPMILGLLGLEGSGREQGRDASPLLRGDGAHWDDEAFLHHSSLERAGIFTPEWEFALVKGGDSILFDRKNDPHQMRNLHGDPRHRSVVDELRQRVVSHHREVESPALKWLQP